MSIDPSKATPMGYGSPLELLKTNAKQKREAATGYRRDAEKALQAAAKYEAEAEAWESAAAILEAHSGQEKAG